ncbi:MAG: hypothetical protein QI199_05285, partial [Candidatus Korarchaeota archaeon]|nr:hypothetical protein [Candidatus Korarchaeota archaeon]
MIMMSGNIAFIMIAVGVLILIYAGYLYLQGSQEGDQGPTSTIQVTKSKARPKLKQKQKPGKKARGPSGTETRSTTQVTKRAETSVRSSSTPRRENPSYETGIFRYAWLKYEVVVKGNRIRYTLENLGEELVDGRECYHQRISVEGPQTSEMEIWYDKGTGRCVKAAIEIPGIGKRDVPCSQASQMPVSGEGMRYVGEERSPYLRAPSTVGYSRDRITRLGSLRR